MRSIGKRRGFTLIELLVVIAIIAILAAILFPVFVKAKERANTTRCQSNLHQLAMAMTAYADDNGGRLPLARVCEPLKKPGEYSWEGSEGVSKAVDVRKGPIFKYARTADLYLCPTDRKLKAGNVDAAIAKKYFLSYSMNYDLSWKLTGAINRASKVLLLIHESRDTINDGDFMWDSEPPNPPPDIPSKVHYDGTTLVYLDGHSGWRSQKQLIAACIAKEWDADK